PSPSARHGAPAPARDRWRSRDPRDHGGRPAPCCPCEGRQDVTVHLRLLAIPPGPAARAALPALREALEGACALLPYAADAPPPPVPAGAVPDTGTALVVATSGSTGTPKLAMLPGSALAASAAGTHERLGGPGTWLLAMPPHHVAGVQVLLR